jgi:hypothetical protein
LRLSTPPAGDEPAVHLAVTLYGDQPFAVVQIELSNITSGPLAVRTFCLEGRLALSAPSRRWRFYKQAWQHWSETKTVVGPCPDEDAARRPANWWAW